MIGSRVGAFDANDPRGVHGGPTVAQRLDGWRRDCWIDRARRLVVDRRVSVCILRLMPVRRPARLHSRHEHPNLVATVALCDESRWHLTTPDRYAVTCHRCMYKLGLYMPLGKLREHQTLNRIKTEAWHH